MIYGSSRKHCHLGYGKAWSVKYHLIFALIAELGNKFDTLPYVLVASVSGFVSGVVELLSCCLELAMIGTNLGSKMTVQNFEKRFIQVGTEYEQSFGAESGS